MSDCFLGFSPNVLKVAQKNERQAESVCSQSCGVAVKGGATSSGTGKSR